MTDENKNLKATGAENAELEKNERTAQPEEIKAVAETDITATAKDAAVAAVKAERERVSEIQAICAGQFLPDGLLTW